MAKTNFTKAEEALTGALQKMSVEQILDQSKPKTATEELKERIAIAKGLQRDLKRLYRQDPEIYKKLEIKRKSFEKSMEDPAKFTEEQWKEILATKNKVDTYVKQLPAESNETLIESERHKHINKRFNVNDKWLPLK